MLLFKKTIELQAYLIAIHGINNPSVKHGMLHVRTVYSDLTDWDTNLFKICGVKDKIAKQSGDTYSHVALVGYYERVLSSLNLP